jgi:hypothetical protein
VSFRRLIAVTLAGVAAIVASGVRADAHEELPGVRAVLDSVTPKLPDGVVVEARISVSDQLVVENRTPTDLLVLGEGGEPFLRIGPQGAFANIKSPTWYRSNDPTGAAVPPKDADAAAEPVFARITTDPAWGWFDHRMHRVSLTRPPGLAVDKPIRLESWAIPMRYGDLAVTVKGHREYRTPNGLWRATVRSSPPELRVFALTGEIPLLSAVRPMSDAPVVTILGEGGEPMARLAPNGVEVNEASPTWAFTKEAQGGAAPSGAVGVGEPPRWVKQSAAQVLWLDRRGQVVTPDGRGRRGQRKEWRVPVLVGERRADVVAETVWDERPIPQPSVSDKGPNLWLIALVSFGGTAVFILVLGRLIHGRRGYNSTR